MSKHTFTDRQGRRFVCDITYDVAKRLRDQLQIDLSKIDESWGRLLTDNETLVDAVWLTIEASATQQQVTPENFGAALGGDQLDAMAEAFMEAVVLFSRPSVRETLRTLWGKQHQAEAANQQRLQQQLESLTPEQLLTCSISVTSKPPSSASTPPGSVAAGS